MKYSLPSILLNPNKFDYSLDDLEISYFQDAKKDLIKKYYNLVSKSIWKAILNNLRRRIELYGIDYFIDNLDENEKNIYFRNSYTLTEKLSLLNNLTIIKNCLKLNIISGKTYTVLNFFYWFHKNDSNEPVLFEDIISIITLLEKNLFKLKIDYIVPEFYIKTQQSKNNIPKEKRRKADFANNTSSTPKRRKNDFINTQTKKIKKEDLFMMQKTPTPRRRKNDFMHLEETSLKRRKDDLIEVTTTPKRRKDDLINTEDFPKRRKNDFNYEENQFIPRKRRKDDFISNQTIPSPRRRRRDD
ncbi:hypothetical protein [Arcobacter sp. LA11]|uniref:hypothetical protein n=1 Tax=Arcobacter sp. LA11 TaxID=1898176 RepID=UPI0009342874|nr:hypothetical protein [Arcobacter sp. LA11]